MNSESLRILHIEDNPDHANLVARGLHEHRIANHIHLIEDGETALDYLLRRHRYQNPEESPRPHIVLLDLRLPKIDGLDILRTIKTTERLVKIPVIVLTSSKAQRDIAQAYECHANGYLVKPVDFDDFMKMMESFGFYWLAWNRGPWPPEMAN